MNKKRVLIFGLAQVAVLIAGYWVGDALHHPGDPPHLFSILGFTSIALLAIGVVIGLIAQSPTVRWGGFSGIGLGLYFWFMMVFDPFVESPSNLIQLFEILLWVLPLLLSGLVYSRIGCWAQAIATLVFLFDCVSLITFNSNTLDVACFYHKIRR